MTPIRLISLRVVLKMGGGFTLLVRSIGYSRVKWALDLSPYCERARPARNDNSWAPSPPPKNIG